MEHLCQTMIFVLGGLTVWLISFKSRKVRLAGFVVGVLSEPFWLYSAVTNAQWGIVILCVVYTGAYLNGVRSHWKR